MKVELEKTEIVVSPLTKEVYIGVRDGRSGEIKQKKEVTNNFISAVFAKYLGDANRQSHEIFSGDTMWTITIEKQKRTQ